MERKLQIVQKLNENKLYFWHKNITVSNKNSKT